MGSTGNEQQSHERSFEREFLEQLGLERLFSESGKYKKRDGTVVQPTPVPGGLFYLAAEWETPGRGMQQNGIDLDTDERTEIISRIRDRRANAAELLRGHRDYRLQLYRIN